MKGRFPRTRQAWFARGVVCALLASCLLPSTLVAEPVQWIGIPKGATEAHHVLEKRLVTAIRKDTRSLTQRFPHAQPLSSVSMLQVSSDIRSGIQAFYAAQLDQAEQFLRNAYTELDHAPNWLTNRAIDPDKVREGAMILARLNLRRNQPQEAESRIQWLLFALPETTITNREFPADIVALGERCKRNRVANQGTIIWTVKDETRDCRLTLNGVREFTQSPAFLPAGTYLARVTCGEHVGWQRKITVEAKEQTALTAKPDVESRFILTEREIRLRSWPIDRGLLRKVAELIQTPVASLTAQQDQTLGTPLLVAERFDQDGSTSVLAWTRAPSSPVEATSTGLTFGALPHAQSVTEKPETSLATILSYTLGGLALAGGLVANILHNQENQSPSTSQDVHNASAARNASIGLYAAGGAGLLTGFVLQTLHNGSEASRGKDP